MTRVDEMRELVNEFATSHAGRQDGLAALRQDVQRQRAAAADAVDDMAAARAIMSVELQTGLAQEFAGLRHIVQTMLGDFGADQQAMAAETWEHLTRTRQQRQHAIGALRVDARQFVTDVAGSRQAMAEDLSDTLLRNRAELSANVRAMLDHFTAARAAMRQELRAILATDQAERHQAVAEMMARTQALLDQFAAYNRATAAALHETLTADRAARQQTVAGMIADINALLSQIATDNQAAAVALRSFLNDDREARSVVVAEFMADTAANRQAMAEHLADRLEMFTTVLQAEMSSSLATFAAERGELHRSLSDMAQVWREFAASMQGAGREKPVPMAPVAAKPVVEPVAAKPVVEPIAAKPVADEDITVRILDYMAEHPAGTKLVELEPVLGLARPQVARHLRNLMESGKVVKDPDTLIYTLA